MKMLIMGYSQLKKEEHIHLTARRMMKKKPTRTELCVLNLVHYWLVKKELVKEDLQLNKMRKHKLFNEKNPLKN